jgi:hypothetical protein
MLTPPPPPPPNRSVFSRQQQFESNFHEFVAKTLISLAKCLFAKRVMQRETCKENFFSRFTQKVSVDKGLRSQKKS